MDVLVVGGAGAIGEWFVDFFESEGWSVRINDPNAEPSEKVSVERAHEFDVVVVSVPIDRTVDVIEEVSQHLEDGLLMDVTSIKKEPVEAMLENTSSEVELLGTHPMFGPSIRSMKGQTVIVSKVRTGQIGNEVISLFESAGANVQEAEPEEHDEMMAVIQGLTHLTYISIGKTLKSLELDLEESKRFMSPVYEITLDFVGRVLGTNPHLYAEIQVNQSVDEVHDEFVDTVNTLVEMVESEQKEELVNEIQEAAKYYGDTRGAGRRSDRLIETKISEYEDLHDSVDEEKEEKALRHVYSGVVHVGKIKEVEGKTITLDKGDEVVELKYGNVQLLSEAEKREWKENNLARKTLDLSAYFFSEVDPEVIEEVAYGSHSDILKVEKIDEYEGESIPEDATSYTFRLVVLDDGNVDEAVEKVRGILEGVGGNIR